MPKQDYIAEIEEKQKFLEQQLELRDKLIIRLLAEVEPLCEECALKSVCANGAQFETCARGLLAAIKLSEKGKLHEII